MDGWMGGWMDGWMNGWMGGWMDGWMNGWMDRWVGGWTYLLDIFVNCNWVDTRWRQYSTQLHTNNTENNTVN